MESEYLSEGKKCLQKYTKYMYADSDHPVQAQSINWAFVLHSYILSYQMVCYQPDKVLIRLHGCAG